MIKISTFNVNGIKDPESINEYLVSHKIDICGMQDVAGIQSMKKLPSVKNGDYAALFDESYKTYGNGLVYNTNKFSMIDKYTAILSTGSTGKKSVFRVTLKCNETKTLIVIYVTHFNHISEPIRLKEWQKLKDIIDFENNTENIFILGDFNALTKSDYTPDEWKSIGDVRKKDNWEIPTSELTDEIRKIYRDCLKEKGCIKPTSRFDTRVDYVFTNETTIHRVQHADVSDASYGSDHKSVIITFNVEKSNVIKRGEHPDITFVDSTYRYGFHVKKHPSMIKTVTEVCKREVSAMQVFVSNPKSKKPPSFDYTDIAAARRKLETYQEMYVVIHGCLLYNLAGTVNGLEYEKSLIETIHGLTGELDYAVALGRPSGVGIGVIIHPGSRVDKDAGHLKVIETIVVVLTKKTKESERIATELGISQADVIKRRKIILENSAGEGTKLCSTLKEIGDVIKGIPEDLRDQVCVCIDTAHAYGKGICDFGKKGEIAKFYDDFDKEIGLKYLEVFHFNDSLVPFGSHKDRHQNLGLGYIFGEEHGVGRFNEILTFVEFARKHNIPMIGEPPGEGFDDWEVVKKLTLDTEFPLEW